jgi:hypothetical protein
MAIKDNCHLLPSLLPEKLDFSWNFRSSEIETVDCKGH